MIKGRKEKKEDMMMGKRSKRMKKHFSSSIHQDATIERVFVFRAKLAAICELWYNSAKRKEQ